MPGRKAEQGSDPLTRREVPRDGVAIAGGLLPAGAASDLPKVASIENLEGKRVFEGACVSCHAWTGAGAIFEEAQLTNVRAVNDASAANDSEIAAVANYVTARFGSRPSRTTPSAVAALRRQQ